MRYKMTNQFARTELLLGHEALNKLKCSRVAVFGIGGVGGYAAEALVRSGLGSIDLIDNDKFALTNLNRQLFATHDTIGKFKVDAAAERLSSINPDCQIKVHKIFYLPENREIDFSLYDYIVDAIDTVSGKIGLVMAAAAANVPIISAMGAGNKLNPDMFKVADINQTSVCPLAHVMRKELRKRGIKKLKVVYSEERPISPSGKAEEGQANRVVPGSVAFVPPVVGLIMAGEVVKDLIAATVDTAADKA